MAAKDLISLARAKQNLQSITDTSQDALLTALITAVSDQIEKFCRRDFISKSYDELYNGHGDRRLLLRQYPIQSVQSVRYRPVTVLKIINTSAPAVIQQARVSVTSTGLALKTVSSGVATVNALTFAANATLQALATAVTALGNGWSGQVVGDPNGDYGLWPAADLYVPPAFGDGSGGMGALTALRQNAELKMHTYELAGYQWDARGWLLRAIPYTDPELLHPEDLIWPVGINNFRIQYAAGYSTVPEAVQEACAEWVAVAYYQTQRDPALTTLSLSGVQRQTWHEKLVQPDQVPPLVARLLAPYRRFTIATDQG
jgi:hypothetical protein